MANDRPKKTPPKSCLEAFLKSFPWAYELFPWAFCGTHGVYQMPRGIVHGSTGRFSKMLPKLVLGGGVFFDYRLHVHWGAGTTCGVYFWFRNFIFFSLKKNRFCHFRFIWIFLRALVFFPDPPPNRYMSLFTGYSYLGFYPPLPRITAAKIDFRLFSDPKTFF